MTIFTPYMSADLYQRVPDWQRIERMITAVRDSREKQPAYGDGCLHGSGSERMEKAD